MQTWLRSGVAVAVAYRLAAMAPIQSLAWELPYAAGVALKKKKKRRHTQHKIKTTLLR